MIDAAPPAQVPATSAVSGAVLTGGASRRMGRDKAMLPVDGIEMARRVADALAQSGCDPVVAIGGDGASLADIGLRTVADEWPGEGPLGAIIVALRDATGPVLVVACDLPWLDAGTLGRLLAVATAAPTADVVHAAGDRPEPLCALWRPSALRVLEAVFSAGERAVHIAIAQLNAVACPVDAVAVTNINRPEDLPKR